MDNLINEISDTLQISNINNIPRYNSRPRYNSTNSNYDNKKFSPITNKMSSSFESIDDIIIQSPNS